MNRNNGDDNNQGEAFAPQEDQPGQEDANAEVEDDHDDEEEEDDGIDRDENRVMDGGVAGSSNANNADDSSTAAPRRRAADCDLVLYITCAETMDDLVPNHPVLKEGVVVSIGLDKNTKLGAVFSRFTEFCNEHSNVVTERVEDSDLEFFHCQLLNANDTAESSALMKNDRIKVRRERAAERETQLEFKRIQRESDKEYFKVLRQLMPEWSGDRRCDLIVDCRGKITDSIGRNQQVLSTKVRGHSTVLSKRCKWLGSLIQTAREERAQKNLVTSDVEEEEKEIEDDSPNRIEFPKGNIVANTSSALPDDNEEVRRREEDMEEDDEIAVLPLPGPHNNRQQAALPQRGEATEIENDEDNDNDSDVEPMGSTSNRRGLQQDEPKVIKEERGQDSNKLWITLPNHSPDAVKLLMEYCYTNRVIGLGHDAFVQACKSKPVKPDGPVSPFSSARRWPKNGHPDVSFSVALAGITLAEEAGLPRLSLMCEIAASQLVNHSNVVEALSICASQKELTGNDLPRLREIAMAATFRYGPRGVYESGSFREALEKRAKSIIPTLFNGTQEAIAGVDKQKNESRKRNFAQVTESYYDELDREDQYKRERERRNRRKERNPELGNEHIIKNEDDRGIYSDNITSSSWASENARRSLKRMSQHLGGFQVGRGSGGGVYGSRDNFGSNRVGSYGRRRNSRRRSSERS